jgi:hypothetical protein
MPKDSKSKEKKLVCRKHGTYADESDVKYLPTEKAAMYNNCLNCAIRSKAQEGGRGFTHAEIGELVGEAAGNVWQIEKKALQKLLRKAEHVKVLQAMREQMEEERAHGDDHVYAGCNDDDVIYGSTEEEV